MCTLAWGRHEGTLWLCFNRDERHERPPSLPPAVEDIGGVPCLFARDPVGGGTWCALSAGGFAVALLNNYSAHIRDTAAAARSRGLLVTSLAGQASAGQAHARLGQEDLSCYRPFHLLLLAQDFAAAVTWDGDSRHVHPDVPAFWTTSSYKPAEVTAWRREWWDMATRGRDTGLADAGSLLRTRDTSRPAFGPTMDRDDARTVSQVEAAIRPGWMGLSLRPREAGGRGYEAPQVVSLPG